MGGMSGPNQADMSLVVANLLVQQMVDHTKDGTMLATIIVAVVHIGLELVAYSLSISLKLSCKQPLLFLQSNC